LDQAPDLVETGLLAAEGLRVQEVAGSCFCRDIQGLVDAAASLVAACEGVDRLLLVPSLAMPVDRVRQYQKALAAAQEQGVSHLIRYGLVPTTVDSPFLITPFLLYAESALRTSGIPCTILRNGLCADPIADWLPTIVEMGTVSYPTEDGACAFGARDDIARAGAAVLTADGHAGKVYNLTGPAALPTGDLCDIVARVTGRPVEDRRATDREYLEACRAEGEPEYFARLLLSLYHAMRDGYLDLVSDDIAMLTGVPAETFEAFLRRRQA
jgi:NAD(P)H dehydrogenase (quinone)